MADLLRATAVFEAFAQSVSVHMVEVSPALREMQRKSLRCARKRKKKNEKTPRGTGDASGPNAGPYGVRVPVRAQEPAQPGSRGRERRERGDRGRAREHPRRTGSRAD